MQFGPHQKSDPSVCPICLPLFQLLFGYFGAFAITHTDFILFDI